MGNCLFDSLAVFVGATSSHALRQAVCRYIADHPHRFDEAIKANGYRSVEQYVRKMSINGVNGDHAVICAAAMLFNMRVHVHMPNGRVFTEEPLQANAATRTAHLRWVPGHYSVPASHRRRRAASVS